MPPDVLSRRAGLYDSQLFGSSFIFEPLHYGFGNLFSTYENFDPPSTPTAEMRVIPASHFYIKSMLFDADRPLYAHSPTGFVPQFHGGSGVGLRDRL